MTDIVVTYPDQCCSGCCVSVSDGTYLAHNMDHEDADWLKKGVERIVSEHLASVEALRQDWINRIRQANDAERRKGGRFRRDGWVNALKNRVRELEVALRDTSIRDGGAE